MDAFAGMKVDKHTGDVGYKGKSETSGQQLGFIMDILAKVSVREDVDITDKKRLPFSINSEMITMRPSGSGARESPGWRTTLGAETLCAVLVNCEME